MVPGGTVVASERRCGCGVGFWFFTCCSDIATAPRTGRSANSCYCARRDMGDPSYALRSLQESEQARRLSLPEVERGVGEQLLYSELSSGFSPAECPARSHIDTGHLYQRRRKP